MVGTGFDETLPVTTHHDVYPAIDPQRAWRDQVYKGKAVFVSGASRGIGRTAALYYAKAGAAVALSARKRETLDETKEIILKEVPSAQVGVYPADVKDSEAVARAIDAAVERFGKLDVLIANAGTILGFDTPMIDRDPKLWWNTFEVNIFGVYNFIRAAMKHLQKVNGYIMTMSSVGAQLRTEFGSDYQISKHALNRLVEFVAQEYPEIKIFTIHPGAVPTELGLACRLDVLKGVSFNDTPELSAATMLALTSGKYDWLNGRFYNSVWDLGEVEREWKDKIVAKELLVNKLAVS